VRRSTDVVTVDDSVVHDLSSVEGSASQLQSQSPWWFQSLSAPEYNHLRTESSALRAQQQSWPQASLWFAPGDPDRSENANAGCASPGLDQQPCRRCVGELPRYGGRVAATQLADSHSRHRQATGRGSLPSRVLAQSYRRTTAVNGQTARAVSRAGQRTRLHRRRG